MVAATTNTSIEQAAKDERTAITVAVTGLEPESALALRAAFETMFAQADEWVARAKAINVTSVEQKREMKLARESRLALREIRVKAEHARKKLKEDSTRRGKAIDGIANVLKALIEPIEAHLLEQETFAERIEDERKAQLKSAREETLRALSVDISAFANLGETSDETWALTLDNAKAAHEKMLEEAKQAELVRVEAERIAADKREAEKASRVKAEAERVERERLAKEENDRLKKEAAERDAAAKADREKAAAEKAALEKKAAEEKAEVEAKAKADREAAAAETRRARDAEQKAAAELAAERKQREEEAKAKADAATKAREEASAAEMAPDREKLNAFAATLRALTIPTLTTPKGKAAAAKVTEQLEKMATWVAKTGAAL